MNWKRPARSVFALLFLVSLFFLYGCSSGDGTTGTLLMTTGFEDLTPRQGLYFSMDYQTVSMEIGFNMHVNPETVPGKIDLYDKTGTLSGNYDVEVDGDSVVIRFHDGYQLKPGWQYFVSISSRVESAYGHPMKEDTTLEIRTASANIFAQDVSTRSSWPKKASVLGHVLKSLFQNRNPGPSRLSEVRNQWLCLRGLTRIH